MVVAYFIVKMSFAHVPAFDFLLVECTAPEDARPRRSYYRLPVPPGGGAVGVAGVAAGVLFAAGIFSFSPTLMRSVFRPLRALISLTVVALALAIFSNVSPVLTTYTLSGPLPAEVAAATDAAGAGITSF